MERTVPDVDQQMKPKLVPATWMKKCVDKWGLNVAYSSSSNELLFMSQSEDTAWRLYFNDRSQFDREGEDPRRLPLGKMSKGIRNGGVKSIPAPRHVSSSSEHGGGLFKIQSKGLLFDDPQWLPDAYKWNVWTRLENVRASLDKICTGMGRHFYCSTDDLIDTELGPSSPSQLVTRTRLYSPCSRRSIELVFQYVKVFRTYPRVDHSRHYFINQSSVTAFLRDSSNDDVLSLLNEPAESRAGIEKIVLLNFEYCQFRHKQIRQMIDGKILRRIQKHLFGAASWPTVVEHKSVKLDETVVDKTYAANAAAAECYGCNVAELGRKLLPFDVFDVLLNASYIPLALSYTDVPLKWILRDARLAFFGARKLSKKAEPKEGESVALANGGCISGRSYGGYESDDSEYDCSSDSGSNRSMNSCSEASISESDDDELSGVEEGEIDDASLRIEHMKRFAMNQPRNRAAMPIVHGQQNSPLNARNVTLPPNVAISFDRNNSALSVEGQQPLIGPQNELETIKQQISPMSGDGNINLSTLGYDTSNSVLEEEFDSEEDGSASMGNFEESDMEDEEFDDEDEDEEEQNNAVVRRKEGDYRERYAQVRAAQVMAEEQEAQRLREIHGGAVHRNRDRVTVSSANSNDESLCVIGEGIVNANANPTDNQVAAQPPSAPVAVSTPAMRKFSKNATGQQQQPQLPNLVAQPRQADAAEKIVSGHVVHHPPTNKVYPVQLAAQGRIVQHAGNMPLGVVRGADGAVHHVNNVGSKIGTNPALPLNANVRGQSHEIVAALKAAADREDNPIEHSNPALSNDSADAVKPAIAVVEDNNSSGHTEEMDSSPPEAISAVAMLSEGLKPTIEAGQVVRPMVPASPMRNVPVGFNRRLQQAVLPSPKLLMKRPALHNAAHNGGILGAKRICRRRRRRISCWKPDHRFCRCAACLMKGNCFLKKGMEQL